MACAEQRSQDNRSEQEYYKLRVDVARMNRLVEQLLRVARLDAIAMDVSEPVELNDAARRVVESMAPWALARKRALAFSGADKPVRVKGNAHAISDAIRNLVENAVIHSPAGAEALVSTYPDGRVSVANEGPESSNLIRLAGIALVVGGIVVLKLARATTQY